MKKKLMTALALILVVAMSVAGTYAYLTSTKTVTNTFTVGSVGITLDEAKVDVNGTKDESATARVTENTYKLMPGHDYWKDPTVHVTKGSEDCYVFIEIKNDIKDLVFEGDETYINAEGETKTEFLPNIETQITGNKDKNYDGNGWLPLTYVENGEEKTVFGVYYKEVKNVSDTEDTDLKVFSGFRLKDDANEIKGSDGTVIWNTFSTATDKPTVTVVAYAVQMDGFSTAIEAWNTNFAD